MENQNNEYRIKGHSVGVRPHPVKNCSAVNRIVNQAPSDTDPFGSYTGKPIDEYERPVQDADDL